VAAAITPRRPGLPTLTFETKKGHKKNSSARLEKSALKGVVCPDSFLEVCNLFLYLLVVNNDMFF